MVLPRLLGGMALAAMFQVAHATQSGAQVVQIQPSGAEVPANLLRVSIEFAAPVEDPVLPRLALLHADGSAVGEPFLPQELWSPDGKILTFLLHPGRVKTGLVAREKLGPILTAGDSVTLTLDGRPIKQWHVGGVDRDGPVATAWKLAPPRAASRQQLTVALDGPVDGRDGDFLAIVDRGDHRVAGSARLTAGESVWTFTPDAPWQAGEYRLLVHGTLEDPAGNRLGGHFETPTSLPQKPATDASLVFTIAPAD